MLPTFFGDEGRELFGIYHPPAADAARDAGVLLCHAGPQDYRHTYWAFRKLAVALAQEGFHVLRFDYHATGDSAGDSAMGSLAQWVDDVATAARELQDVAGVRRVSVVGMRLGGALAAAACAAGLKLRDLVLWDPVVSGRAYLDQLAAVQQCLLSEQRPPQRVRCGPDELLGYPMPPAMRASLQAIDLLGTSIGTPARVFVVASQDRPEYRALDEQARARGLQSAIRVVDDPTLYAGGTETADTLLAHNVLRAIVDHLASRPS